MQLKLTNSETEYDLSLWTVDLPGIKFRNSYNERFGQPGQERQGDGKESGRTINFTYGIDGESDGVYIANAEALYAMLRAELAPFYLIDEANLRRLAVSPDELDLQAKPGTELRYSSARLRLTALDTFWEASTATPVDPGSAAVENGDAVSCLNPGVINVYPIITISPTEQNPNFYIFNDTTDDVIGIGSNSFVPGSSIEINCQAGTVYLTIGSTRTEISSAIATGTGFLYLAPGANSLRYASGYGPVTMEVSYRRRWAF